MDSLKTLIDKKQYNLVIKATENCSDAESLFYRIIALGSLAKFSEAIEVIQKNKNVLEASSLGLLIDLHIDILLLAERFDDAYLAYDYYKELPYHSQVVEEKISSIPTKIREAMKETYKSGNKDFSDDDIKKALSSNEINNLFMAIEKIKDGYYLKFLKEIKTILLKGEKQSIRSFLLMFLVEQKFDQEIDFNSEGKVIRINPSKIKQPFIKDEMKELEKFCFSLEKDVTFTNTFLNIYSSISMYKFPSKIELSDKVSLFAIYAIAKKAIMQEVDIYRLALNHNISSEELNDKVDCFNTILADF